MKSSSVLGWQVCYSFIHTNKQTNKRANKTDCVYKISMVIVSVIWIKIKIKHISRTKQVNEQVSKQAWAWVGEWAWTCTNLLCVCVCGGVCVCLLYMYCERETSLTTWVKFMWYAAFKVSILKLHTEIFRLIKKMNSTKEYFLPN